MSLKWVQKLYKVKSRGESLQALSQDSATALKQVNLSHSLGQVCIECLKRCASCDAVHRERGFGFSAAIPIYWRIDVLPDLGAAAQARSWRFMT